MFIVIYRKHGDLYNDTRHIGPFDTFVTAYEHLGSLPSIGAYDEELHAGQYGLKYIAELEAPSREG